MSFTKDQQQILLDIAQQSILFGLKQQRLSLTADYPTKLQQLAASFVTLQLKQQLRGCIGSLTAHRPLVADINHNAYAAAFSDPRFPPISLTEYPKLNIHISVLNPAESMEFTSEQQLLQQLRPDIDGLILQKGQHKATFLPSVWQSLPKPEQFLQQLKRKAGLPADYWSDAIVVQRYTTESF